MSERMVPPVPLAAGGMRLWDSMLAEFELRPDELALLLEACRTQDLIDHLAVELEEQGALVPGSKGQSRVSTLAVEVRQQRVTLGRLLGQLGIADGPPSSGAGARLAPVQSARSQHARRAAEVRWRRERGETA